MVLTEGAKFEEHEKYVYFVINKHTLPIDRDEDMEQEGRIGLLKAIREFDPERGRFSHVAYTAIKNRVCDEVRRRNRRRANDPPYQFEDRDSPTIDKSRDRIDTEDDAEFLLRFARPRETEIIRRLFSGETSVQIGLDLGVTPQRILEHKREGIRRIQRLLRGIRGRNYQKELRPHPQDVSNLQDADG